MIGAKQAAAPCDYGSKLSKTHGDLLLDPTEYRQIVDALQYCTLKAWHSLLCRQTLSTYACANLFLGLQLSEFYVISKALWILVSSMHPLHSHFRPFVILIGLQQVAFSLDKISSLGVLRNKMLSLGPAHKRNTDQWHWQLLIYIGYECYLENFMFQFFLLLHFGVTTLALLPLPQIWLFMPILKVKYKKGGVDLFIINFIHCFGLSNQNTFLLLLFS